MIFLMLQSLLEKDLLIQSPRRLLETPLLTRAEVYIQLCEKQEADSDYRNTIEYYERTIKNCKMT